MKAIMWRLIVAALLAAGIVPAFSQPLFESRALTPPGEYTFGIEGPSVDAAGNLYVANFGRPGAIGKLVPGASRSEFFATLPEGSTAVSTRIGPDRRLYVADYKRHNIFVFAPGSAESQVYFRSDAFNQPNDMTFARDGTLYASDPNFRRRGGQVWRIMPDAQGASGAPMTAPRKLTTTNGIDLSPDEKTLYVGEAATNEIWAYRIDGDKLVAPRLIKKFPDFEIDGLRTDIDGRIYVARILKGMIEVLTPDGKTVREIALTAAEPTNLAFGGPDGKTVYVTQRKGGYIETFRTDRPGREFCLLRPPGDAACR